MRNFRMRKVKVKRTELLEKVSNNRSNHKETYQKAVEVYNEEALAEIQKMLADAKAGKIRHNFNLVKPEQHLDEYDQAIEMLRMSVDDIIELDSDEFAQYVMNKWSWARQFEANTVSYASKFKRLT